VGSLGVDRLIAETEIVIDTPAGGGVRDEELHLWTFNAHGKVQRFRHYFDTAKHIAAAQGRDTRVRPAAA
jgi:uncharacterized protein